MIAKTPIITNSDDLKRAEDLNLPNIKIEEEYDYVEMGFKLQDIMYYKIVNDEIELSFRNGREEVIQYTNSIAAKLKTTFENL